MNVLVTDIGGSNVKILATGQNVSRRFPSGPTMTPKQMIAGVKKLARDWKYDAVSIGYPGPVIRNRPLAEPHNLGRGWIGFDFEAAFERPVKVVNDAAMQALGSYNGGKMLFLGLGTGLGSAMIVEGIVEPMELGHLPYKKRTFEDYVGIRGYQRLGKKKWRKNVADVLARLIAALEPKDVVLGGGNVKKLKQLPPGCRAGNNANAFVGGFRLWKKAQDVSCRKHSLALTTKKEKPAGTINHTARGLVSLFTNSTSEEEPTAFSATNSSTAFGAGSILRTPGREKAGGTAEQGYLHCGPNGAGHFVKMVHNGIEYGIMAAYAEGLGVLRAANVGKQTHEVDAETTPLRHPEHYQYDLNLPNIAEVWRRGSVIASWLLDLTAAALIADPALSKFAGRVSDSGEGRWTITAAIDEGVRLTFECRPL